MDCASIQPRFSKMTRTVDLSGTYSWQLLFDIDNSENEGEIKRTETVKSSLEVNHSNLIHMIKNYSAEGKLGTTYEFGLGEKIKLVDISIKSGCTSEIVLKAVRELKDTTDKSTKKTVEESTTTEITIGKKSRLLLYRLVFNGPGVSYATSTLSSKPHKMEDVILSCSYASMKFLKDITVVYTDDEASIPHDCIQEVNGHNANINAGYKGYSWLVPVWTSNQDEGVTSIKLIIQSSENSAFQNMTKGRIGRYRYLKMMRDGNSASRITSVGLWRGGDDTVSKMTAAGWNWTENINCYNDSQIISEWARALDQLTVTFSPADANAQLNRSSHLHICWQNTTV